MRRLPATLSSRRRRLIPIQITNPRRDSLVEARPPQIHHSGVVIQPLNLALHLLKRLSDEVVTDHVRLSGITEWAHRQPRPPRVPSDADNAHGAARPADIASLLDIASLRGLLTSAEAPRDSCPHHSLSTTMASHPRATRHESSSGCVDEALSGCGCGLLWPPAACPWPACRLLLSADGRRASRWGRPIANPRRTLALCRAHLRSAGTRSGARACDCGAEYSGHSHTCSDRGHTQHALRFIASTPIPGVCGHLPHTSRR